MIPRIHSARLQAMHLWWNHSGSEQYASFLRNHWQLWEWFRYDNHVEKPLFLPRQLWPPKEVSVDAAKASVISELKSRFHLMKSKECSWRLFAMEKDVFDLLSTDFGKIFIYQLALLWYALLLLIRSVKAGLWKMVIDKWFVLSPAKYILKVPAFSQRDFHGRLPRWFNLDSGSVWWLVRLFIHPTLESKASNPKLSRLIWFLVTFLRLQRINPNDLKNPWPFI